MLLPVGLVVALITAMLLPGPGLWLGESNLTFLLIATIFFINGYQTLARSIIPDRRMSGGGLIAGVVAFGGGGFFAWLIGQFLGASPLTEGLIVMCVMAPTLSSVIVITRESGGNPVWATLLTMGLNLMGILIIPPLLALLLAGGGTELPVLGLFFDLVLSVLLPFCLGVALRHWLVIAPGRLIGLIPTLLVILLSYVSFSGGRGVIVESGLGVVIKMAAIALGIHLALLVLALGLTRLFGFARDERKAIAFLSSQKTLPVAVGVLTALGSAAGPALLPCVLFHFAQILVDALIANRWKRNLTADAVPLAASN